MLKLNNVVFIYYHVYFVNFLLYIFRLNWSSIRILSKYVINTYFILLLVSDNSLNFGHFEEQMN